MGSFENNEGNEHAYIEIDFSYVVSVGEKLRKAGVKDIAQYLFQHEGLVKELLDNSIIISNSKSIIDMLQIVRPEMLHKAPLTRVIGGNFVDYFIEAVQAWFEGKSSYEKIFPIRTGKKNHYLTIIARSYLKELDNSKTIVRTIIWDFSTIENWNEASITWNEKLNHIIASMPTPMYMINAKGIVVFHNKAMQDLLEGDNLLINKHYSHYIHPEDLPMVAQNFANRVAEARAPNTYQFRMLTHKGNTRHVVLNVSLMRIKTGEKLVLGFVVDATETIENKKKIQYSEERFKAIVEHSFDGIALMNKHLEISYSNKNWNMLFPNGFQEILHKGNEAFRKYVQQCLETEKQKSSSKGNAFEIQSNTGEIKTIEFSHSRLLSAEGQQFIILHARDISEREKARRKIEQALEEARRAGKTFNDIFNNSIMAIYIMNEHGEFIDINKGAELMYQMSKEELKGKTPAYVSADGRNDLETVAALHKAAYEKEEPQELEFWGRRKNGEVFPKTVRLSPGNYYGRKVVYAFAMDITQIKKYTTIQNVMFNISKGIKTTQSLEDFGALIQQELSRVIKAENIYIALYDEQNDEFTFPFYADRYDHYTRAKAYKSLGKHVIETGMPLLADDAKKKELFAARKLIRQGSYSKVWMGAPLIDEKGVSGVLAVQDYEDANAYNEEDLEIFNFVTQQIAYAIDGKRKDLALRQALEKARESDRLKSAFLANMSHEIRTPMNGILGYTQLLHQDDLDEESKKLAVETIERSGHRLLNIINNVLEVSRIEAKQVSIDIASVNVYELVMENCRLFKQEAENKGLELRCMVDDTLKDKPIRSDSSKLHSILSNLIKNAIKYTLKGEVSVMVKRQGGQLYGEVSDTGIGIEESRHEAIFNRFEQADIEDRQAFEGAGLGLSIVKAYVELLGGSIGLSSKPHVGSRFWFTVPFNTPGRSEERHDKEDEMFTTAPLHILAVDDEPTSLMILKLMTRHMGSIYTTTNGLEAIDILKKNPQIDLVLLDIKMPHMSGFDVLKAIKEIKPDLPVIGQSAFALLDEQQKAIEAGFDAYITKPVQREELYKTIEVVLNRKSGSVHP